MSAKIIIAIVAVLVVCALIASRLLTRGLIGDIQGDSPAELAESKRLMETGHEARATILSIDYTGLIVNKVNVKCNVRFHFDPLGGGTAFEGEKMLLIQQMKMPRVGDVWPSWYDTQDVSKFEIMQPDFANSTTQEILERFGIDNPLAAIKKK